jgi:peptidoglycan/xylan/chitin deacetylase (PgdA/CDA1 family)
MVRKLALGTLFAALAFALAACGGSAGSTATWHAAPSAAGQGGGESLDGDSAPGTAGFAARTASSGTGLNLSQKMTNDGTVALTFDDGPSEFTPQILAILRQQNVKATFCLVGINVRAHHDYVQQIVREGHTLCNHTWKHDLQLGKRSADEIRADLQATNDEIHRAVPDAPIKYFRHPGGNFTKAAVEVAKDLGMASVGWDVDPGDWDSAHHQGADLTQHIINNVRSNTRPGSIILSHDAGGDRTCTMAAYRTLLPELKSRFKLAALPA